MRRASTAATDGVQQQKARYMVAAVSEFARYANLPPKQAHRYLADHRAIQFLDEHYEVEHLLSFDDVVADLIKIAAQSGGTIR